MRTGWLAAGTWVAVVLLALAAVRGVIGDPLRLVPGPYGGVDAVYQAGLLAWTSHWWWRPAVWLTAPVFFPATDALWTMDTLLGQGILAAPLLAAGATPALLYDGTLLLSLLLAALAAGWLWRAGGGERDAAGVMALAVLAAPYTTAQLGHLNQLPPFLALVAAGTFARGLATRRWRWLALGVLLWACQPLFGWYGVVQGGLLLCGLAWTCRRELAAAAAGHRLPLAWTVVIAVVLLLLQAAPYRAAQRRDPGLAPASARELRWYSADLRDLLQVGAYRARPADWWGKGPEDPARSATERRHVVHPGWVTLVLGLAGLALRHRLPATRRRLGDGLLLAGIVGLVFAFGESCHWPGSHRLLPLPWGWLRAAVPPLRGYRAVCRFAWPLAVALAWWAAAAWRLLLARGRGRRWLAAAVPLLLLLEGVPMGIPAVALPRFPVRAAPAPDRSRPLLSLPVPAREEAEDRTEAAWWLAAQQLGRPISGGVGGRVPSTGRRWRERLGGPGVTASTVRRAMTAAGIGQAVTPVAGPPAAGAWAARLRRAGWTAADTAGWRIWTPPVTGSREGGP